MSARLSSILSLMIVVCLIAGGGYYVYETRPCAQPIYYTIGTFDSQFGVDQATFLADAAEAANLWNQEAGHTVLAYKVNGRLPINLIFDTRQQTADVGASIQNQESTLGTQKAQITQLKSQYDAAEQQLNADKAAGKSPAQLNSEIDALNQLAAQLNSETATFNQQVSQVNAVANAYNTQAGTDFNEGEYVREYGSTYINIYEFQNHTQLVRILAHEMGHALGLGHNQDPNSIMYPENEATTIALSAEDKAALAARCAVTLQNLMPFQQPSLSSN